MCKHTAALFVGTASDILLADCGECGESVISMGTFNFESARASLSVRREVIFATDEETERADRRFAAWQRKRAQQRLSVTA